jgi:hypothetical protein
VVKEHPTVKQVLVEYYQERLGSTAEKRGAKATEEKQGDSRQKDRVSVKLVVLPQTTPTGEAKASSWNGISVDVAESGIVVRVSGAPPETFLVQGEVRLEIDLPEPWGEIRTLGTIRRVKTAQTAKDMTMVGIEYSGMAEADAKKLRNYLSGGD